MSNPIILFQAITLVPINLRAFGAGFKMGGRFKVQVKFDPSVDCSRYEYRQFIKGEVSVQQGTFSGRAPSLATWTATGALHNAMHDFQIAGGLQTSFTEDNQTVGGVTRFYGHRSNAALSGTDQEDRYLPSQATGCEYRAIDTYGLEGNSRPAGLRIKMKIVWQGRVIDTARGNRILDTRHWGVEKDDIIV